ncbi:MAG: type II secretion system protein [Candidatus Gracilibacteria bacterium]|nr:type II secretion system protein [Candidatus Gracilibacteria bacterium]
MINKKEAFTIIELIFVISILIFLSFSSLFYFNSFSERKKIDLDVGNFYENYLELGNSIKNKENSDYVLILSDLYYYYYLNSYFNGMIPLFSYDVNSKLFSIDSGLSFTGTSVVSIFSNEKLLKKESLVFPQVLTGALANYVNYNFFVKNIVGETSIGLKYYSEDNLDLSGITTNFIQANTKIDKSGLSTKNLIIKNINNKIKFYSGTTLWDFDNVYLVFEKAGVEKILEIGK